MVVKELLHFTMKGSAICKEVEPEIKKLLAEKPEIKYSKIDEQNDADTFQYYAKKYGITVCPTFLGIVDGELQDGHEGYGSAMVLGSLVG